MKSIKGKILRGTICLLVMIILVMTVISVLEINKVSGTDSENLMKVACEKEVIRFNDEFKMLENSVTTIAAYVENLEAEAASPEELLSDEFCARVKDMTLSIANRTDGAMAVYFRYNPELTGNGTQGFFFSRNSDDENFVYEEPTDILQYDKDDTEHVGWFYEPKEKHEAIWMSPYYNKNLDVFMISYIIPYYTQSGDFLGVIGMDIDFNKIVMLTDDVSLYKSGEINLVDLTSLSLYSTDENGTIQSVNMPDALYKSIADIKSDENAALLKADDGKEFLTCSGQLSNGMRVLLYVPMDEINEQRNRVLIMSAVVMTLSIALSVIIMVNLTHRIVNPLKKLTEITKEYADGKWDNKFVSDTGDEVQQLSESISVMAETTKTYIDRINESAEAEKEARQEADFANKAKGQFLANMSHEIRTPINAILGMDTMILRESNESQIKEFAMNIKNAGDILLSLINDILDFSKIDAGKMEIVPGKYELSVLVNDVVNMVSIKAQDKELAVNLEMDGNLPSVLYGDDIRIRQILINLMNNAIKYTEKGSVTLCVNGETTGDTAALNIHVRDTGIGIREEDIEKLTEEFVRIEEERNKKIEGTGLGMNISVQLLELMDSKLEVSSVYGQGSDFSFTIRQKIIDPKPVGNIANDKRRSADSYSYKSLFYAPDARVLVVDDNKLNRLVFTKLLKKTGLQIDEADGGKKAVEMSRLKPYDIIFLDHMMPDMSGIQVLEVIRSEQDNPNTKALIVALTANAISGAREEYLAAGFDNYLSKPFVPEKLEEMICSYLPPEKKSCDNSEEKTEESAVTAEITELPVIEGVDWDYAKLHLTDRDMLIDTVRSFAKSIDSGAKELEKLYGDVIESSGEEALELFRIKVHALKSSATLIGIVPIAGMALTLETAARDNRTDVIKDMTPHFLKALREYKEKLSPLMEAECEQKEIDDIPKLKKCIAELKEALWNFDVHGSDSAIKILSGYRYDAETKTILDKLTVAVNDLDVDSAIILCDEMIDKIKE